MSFYVGRFRAPRWLYDFLPSWIHRAADKLGGVR
jgi:hypothetical protein